MGKIDPNTFTLEESFTPRVPNAKIKTVQKEHCLVIKHGTGKLCIKYDKIKMSH